MLKIDNLFSSDLYPIQNNYQQLHFVLGILFISLINLQIFLGIYVKL
jgi:hypothetical protein